VLWSQNLYLSFWFWTVGNLSRVDSAEEWRTHWDRIYVCLCPGDCASFLDGHVFFHTLSGFGGGPPGHADFCCDCVSSRWCGHSETNLLNANVSVAIPMSFCCLPSVLDCASFLLTKLVWCVYLLLVDWYCKSSDELLEELRKGLPGWFISSLFSSSLMPIDAWLC